MQVLEILIEQFNNVLQLCQYFITVVQMIRQRRQNSLINDNDDIEIIMINNMYLDIISTWFNMVV